MNEPLGDKQAALIALKQKTELGNGRDEILICIEKDRKRVRESHCIKWNQEKQNKTMNIIMHMHLNYYPFSEMIAIIFPSDQHRNATKHIQQRENLALHFSLIHFDSYTLSLYSLCVCVQICRFILRSPFHTFTIVRTNEYLRLINTIKINLYSSQIQLAAKQEDFRVNRIMCVFMSARAHTRACACMCVNDYSNARKKNNNSVEISSVLSICAAYQKRT